MMVGMHKLSREKMALVVFAALVIGGLAALLIYIFVIGHSLNATASNIDDATGNLDGYTVILYEGTADKHTETVVEAASSDPFAAKSPALTLNRKSNQENTEAQSDEVTADEATPDQDEEASDAPKLTLLSLSRQYVEKQAKVIVLDLSDRQAYGEQTVIRSGGKTYGLFSIDEISAQPTYFNKRIAAYRALDVDFIVCVTSDLSLMESYSGADIVVSQQDEGLSSHGASLDGVFYEDAALKGQIGSVLISPSRTITAKDVSSL